LKVGAKLAAGRERSPREVGMVVRRRKEERENAVALSFFSHSRERREKK